MSKIKKQLTELAGYLSTVRQVGHTYTMLHGAAKSERVAIVVHNYRMGEIIKKDAPNADMVSLNNMDALRGRNHPLAFDNAALYQLFSDAVKEITRLEDKSNVGRHARATAGSELHERPC